MENVKQLLNSENWVKYIRLANEWNLSDEAIANDIVSKIREGITKDEKAKAILLDLPEKYAG